jgi:polyphosphate kinase
MQTNDRFSAWEMRSDGSYQHLRPEKEGTAKGVHQLLIEWAEKRNKDVTRLKKRKTKGFGGKNTWL